LWPAKGDYDFNDMVIDYNFRQITNPQNEVFEIEASFVLRAIGASYRNGFGFSLNTSPENITEISGQALTKDLINLNSNGTEAGQSLATIMVFDDAFGVLRHPGGGTGINTNTSQPFVEPVTINMKITFNEPVPYANMNVAPYNPFIFINGNRAKEVHLPMHPPTDLADMSLLGTKHDDSDPGQLIYYASDQYLPWAINLPVSFTYPKEKEDITEAYRNFTTWATTQGVQNSDWYLNNPGYRNNSLLYAPE
jgi:LruC domain-containing protein